MSRGYRVRLFMDRNDSECSCCYIGSSYPHGGRADKRDLLTSLRMHVKVLLKFFHTPLLKSKAVYSFRLQHSFVI